MVGFPLESSRWEAVTANKEPGLFPDIVDHYQRYISIYFWSPLVLLEVGGVEKKKRVS